MENDSGLDSGFDTGGGSGAKRGRRARSYRIVREYVGALPFDAVLSRICEVYMEEQREGWDCGQPEDERG